MAETFAEIEQSVLQNVAINCFSKPLCFLHSSGRVDSPQARLFAGQGTILLAWKTPHKIIDMIEHH
ncbi:MAG TPA: hypothetical protein V6C52_00115 [Coleofasciculaceae cyanobacterium]